LNRVLGLALALTFGAALHAANASQVDPNAGLLSEATKTEHSRTVIEIADSGDPTRPAMLEPLAQFEAWRAEGARFIAHGFFERAWRRMARDELDAALADFDRGLELDPSRRDALLARARLLIRLNRVECRVG
jgi:hypothetical protein